MNRSRAAAVIGYRPETHVSVRAQVACKTAIALAVALFGWAAVRTVLTEPAPTRANVQVLQTLEAFTQATAPDAGNTIPAFLASAGRLGRLRADGLPDEPVTSIDETGLRQAFCSSNLAALVRHEYPGYYDRWPDARLERLVLEKHPDYRGRSCMLPTRLDAGADEVIKYELAPRTAAEWLGRWLLSLLATSGVAILFLNGYYRLMVRSCETRPHDLMHERRAATKTGDPTSA